MQKEYHNLAILFWRALLRFLSFLLNSTIYSPIYCRSESLAGFFFHRVRFSFWFGFVFVIFFLWLKSHDLPVEWFKGNSKKNRKWRELFFSPCFYCPLPFFHVSLLTTFLFRYSFNSAFLCMIVFPFLFLLFAFWHGQCVFVVILLCINQFEWLVVFL